MNLKNYLDTDKTEIGIPASKIDIKNIEEVGELTQFRDEIVVSNKFGYMKTSTDEYTDMFINDAISIDAPVLEIGTAYGYVVQKILKAGGRITALDIGERNLEILLKQTPSGYLENLHVYPAAFPDDAHFEDNTFSAVLASRVLHFLDGKNIEIGLDKIHKWLKPNGKFYFTAVSVEHETFREAISPLYKSNVEKGMKWRGEIEDQHIYAPQHAEYVPKFIHAFDVEGLSEVLPQHGFEVEKISLFNYLNDTTAGNTGHVGFAARKV
jgi:SAM-dependent methyltransferase